MESDREVYYPPIFFVSVYMDELSTALNGCNVGCYVGYWPDYGPLGTS